MHRLVNFKYSFALPTKSCWQGNMFMRNFNVRVPKQNRCRLPYLTTASLRLQPTFQQGFFCALKNHCKIQYWKQLPLKGDSALEKKSSTNWLEIPYMHKRVLQNTNEMTVHKKPESGLQKNNLVFKTWKKLCWGWAYILTLNFNSIDSY